MRSGVASLPIPDDKRFTPTYHQIQVQLTMLVIPYRVSQIRWECQSGVISASDRVVWTS